MTFFPASIALGIIALVIHSIATDEIAKGSRLKAQRISLAVSQHTAYTPDPEAQQLFHSARILIPVGTAFIVSCALCVFVAMARRESGWYSIPLLLIFFDFALQMFA